MALRGQAPGSPGKASCGRELLKRWLMPMSGSWVHWPTPPEQSSLPLMLGFCSTCIVLWRKDPKKRWSSLQLQESSFRVAGAAVPVKLSQVRLDPGWSIRPAPRYLESKLWKYSLCSDLGPMDELSGSGLIWGCEPCCSQHEASFPAAHRNKTKQPGPGAELSHSILMPSRPKRPEPGRKWQEQ